MTVFTSSCQYCGAGATSGGYVHHYGCPLNTPPKYTAANAPPEPLPNPAPNNPTARERIKRVQRELESANKNALWGMVHVYTQLVELCDALLLLLSNQPPNGEAGEGKQGQPCRKCRSPGTSVRYVSDLGRDGYLDGRCRDCGYTWFESCADAKEAGSGEGKSGERSTRTDPAATVPPPSPAAPEPPRRVA